MNFSEALFYLKNFRKVRRIGWNGKGLYVTAYFSNLCGDMFIIVNTKTDKINSWVPSISDIFADDWELYE